MIDPTKVTPAYPTAAQEKKLSLEHYNAAPISDDPAGGETEPGKNASPAKKGGGAVVAVLLLLFGAGIAATRGRR